MNKKLFKITKNLKESSGYSTGISIKKAKKNLITIRQILITNKKKIIQAICLDVKKTLVDAKNEFNGSIKIWNFAINNFHLVKRQKKIYFSNKKKGIINYEPIGVVAFITPWNYPLLTLSERLPFCIACGCAAVLKPSEFTPNFSEILKKIIDSKTKERMKEVLKDIQSGKFAKQWMDENKNGQKNFLKMRKELADHPIEKVGKKLRDLMPWIGKNKLVNKEKN